MAAAKGWVMSYSAQANLCHAYHILRGNGIPEENIIVMMYDDIAYNELNPTKGVIINRPGGPNVYENVKKDYTGKMFFYLESCHSGSMFQFLPNNSKIFAMTSASPSTGAAMCFCNVIPSTCLAGEFDYYWMRDAETIDLKKEVVQQQFKKVRKETRNSTVHEYGDLNLSQTKTSEVLGFRRQLVPRHDHVCDLSVVSQQIPELMLEYLIHNARDPEEKKMHEKKLQDLYQARNDTVQFFSQLAKELLTPDFVDLYEETISKEAELTRTNLACYENAVTYLNDNCFKLGQDPFVGAQLHTLINLCNLVPEARLVESIQSVWHKQPIHQVDL